MAPDERTRLVADRRSLKAGSGAALRDEARAVAAASAPVVATYLLQFSFNFASLVVVGRIGADELAAAALANMALVVGVFSPGIGLASALDTLCASAFAASPDRTLVGFHLQRALVAAGGYLALVLPALWRLEPILVAVGQDARVARLCGAYVRVQLLAAAPWLGFECVKRFLQGQGIMHASTCVLLAALPAHLAGSWLLVWSPAVGIGFLGAAAANAVTCWLALGGLVLYVRRSRARRAWGGWTPRALRAMPQYLRLALPAVVMLCAEWWILDLLALAASYLGSATLAAQSIAINSLTVLYQVPDGLSVAVCNRVGRLLGQARPRRARLAAWLGIALGAATGVAALAAALAVGGWWGRVYSSDPAVVAAVARIAPVCAVFQMLDSANSVGCGVLRALGRQAAGARINFAAYYVLGFPLGLYLTYGAPAMGVAGLWVGIAAGVGLAVALQLLVCARTRWPAEAARCRAQVAADRLLA
ncbi:ethionine resistance protein [Coemansia javaensis]|uniref:Ethionine resistance protein n=1 Tax=Coemansia javaensis TaxID=2761396 RepID=A0A9W8LL26_9FUNG|nr:ethionine resistance protein [Coemansia javaensis]